ncbi:MAG TPA: arylesterase [Steroidobacteraceae bacterium]|nr:arylesterase [Steroidobacteraceae bacterium]
MRTFWRTAVAWALGIGLLVIGFQDAPAAQNRTILVFGDSLSAAYGLRPEQGWVALLQRRLQTQGYGYHTVNASISGETTSGGLQRLPRALQLHRPAIVLLELGANDGLRGLPLATIRGNLAQLIELARNSGARVLLLGIRLPPNYGPRYGNEFTALYTQSAQQLQVPLVPFVLAGTALNPELMQADGLHPNAQGEPHVLDTVWPYLLPLLRKP